MTTGSSPAGSIDLATYLRDRVPVELCAVLVQFGEASARVRAALETAPLAGLLGTTGNTNVQGESTAKLDDFANDIFVEALTLPHVKYLISEEIDEPIHVGDGPYTLAFDPLDGSSNIGFASVGSVLGVYEGVASDPFAAGVTGRKLIASGFVVYGLPAMLVIATGGKVTSFAFDPTRGGWLLVGEQVRVPKATYTSINWTYQDRWPQNVQRAVAAASEGLRGRYSGSMVEDVLRVLLAGGVFMYPEDFSSPNGKLRMLYEVCPIGYVMEIAGGAASAGGRSVLDVPITEPHQRGPLVTGSAEAVARYDAAYTPQRVD